MECEQRISADEFEDMHYEQERSAEKKQNQDNQTNHDAQKTIEELKKRVRMLEQQLREKEASTKETRPSEKEHDFITSILLNAQTMPGVTEVGSSAQGKEAVTNVETLPETEIERVAIKRDKNKYKCGKYIMDEAFGKLCEANEKGGKS